MLLYYGIDFAILRFPLTSSSTEPGTELPMPQTVPTKPYDWTYTTIYAGHEPEPSSSQDVSGSELNTGRRFIAADPEDKTQSIPLAELTRPDPILFYAEVPLFEDELHDNGASSILVRVVRRYHSLASLQSIE